MLLWWRRSEGFEGQAGRLGLLRVRVTRADARKRDMHRAIVLVFEEVIVMVWTP